MNKVLIEMGETTKEYHVPYAIARAIETMLNHTDYARADVDTRYFKQKSHESE